ncbi:MAG: hypothetical protein U0V70_05120 [Terriglobia bacterium]
MKTLGLCLVLCSVGLAGELIHTGAKIYVSPTPDDFDRYLMGEIQSQDLPIVLVRSRGEAEFEISLNSGPKQNDPKAQSVLPVGENKEIETLSVINLKTGQVVYSDTFHFGKGKRDNKSASEVCVKHLRKVFKKH